MPTIVTGAKSTLSTELASSRLVLDVASGIYLLDPNENPATRLLDRIGAVTAKQPTHSWLEDELQPEVAQVSVAASAASTALQIKDDHYDYFAVGDLVQVFDSYEIMYVNSVSTDGYIRVSRNFPGIGASSTGAATALTEGDYLTILGNANEEGAGAPTAKHTVESQVDNYSQIVRTPFELTETELNALMNGEQDLPYQTRKHGIEHARKLEWFTWFGIPSSGGTGSDGKPMRTMGGVWWFLKENAPSGNIASQAEVTEDEFLDWLRNCFRYGSSRKVMFMAPLIASAIEKWGLVKLQHRPMDKTMGIAATNWQSPHGQVALVIHKMLEGPNPGTAGGWAFMLDMNEVKRVPYRNRDTKLRINIQDPDEDKYKAEYLTECTLEIHNPAKHGVLYNVTSFASS